MEDNRRKDRQRKLIFTAFPFYAAFFGAALLWARIAGLEPLWALRKGGIRGGPAARIGIGGWELFILLFVLLLNIIFDLYGPRLIPSTRPFFRTLGEIFQGIGLPEAFVLAAVSAIGEEFLFRGAVQAGFGLIPASILFALSHFPVRRELLLWPFYAFLMGLALGALKILGGDIWSAVLLHFLVNFFALSCIGRRGAGTL